MSQADEKIGRVEVDVGPYRWSQSVDEVSITIILSPGIRGKDISCKITANKLFLQIKGQSPIFDVSLSNPQFYRHIQYSVFLRQESSVKLKWKILSNFSGSSPYLDYFSNYAGDFVREGKFGG
eukprot:TRINITY_DN4032_c0_g1_i3.p1 TRINITY_DN4032_c0_g1~~TRINITY_DN4032_c0_g1_i3.p1  ORF type:complete len:136 (+),score=29.97 TRINITY_DN4032_c0_g1_i3:42-410(+)